MKRSASVRLTIMGAATAMGLTACGDGVVAPGNYATFNECTAAGNSTQACTRAADAALRQHRERAPRFPTREDCLRAVDTFACEEVQVPGAGGATTAMFVPAIAGFMLARQVSSGGGGGGGALGSFYASRDYPGRYRDMDNLTTSRSPGPAGSAAAPAIAPSRPPNVNTTTVARSGFGSTSSSHGGSSS